MSENSVLYQKKEKYIYYVFITLLLLRLFMFAIINLFAWGVISLFEGNQKNSSLSRIRENGTRMTAKVVSCELNEQYSSGTVSTYTYFVDFVVNGQERRGATISFLYSLEGSVVDIYYLPCQRGSLGGVAIAEEDGNPGKVKIIHGILGIAAAVIFFLLWIKIKDFIQTKDAGGEEKQDNAQAFIKTARKDRENRRTILRIGTIVFFCLGLFFLVSGVSKNWKLSQIKEQGIKTEAVVKKSETVPKFLFIRIHVHLREYVVEFVVDGKNVRGKAVSRESYSRDESVDIYYLSETKKEIRDVAFAVGEDNPGYLDFWHAFQWLFFALIFLSGVIKV